MQLTTYNADFFESPVFQNTMIDNWYDLGVRIGVPTYKMSNALKFQKKLQHKIVLKDGKKSRVTYDSMGSLKFIQKRLSLPLALLQEEIYPEHRDTNVMLAYRKGVNAVDVIKQECCDMDYEVLFDIKKYFDHINLSHIQKALTQFGYTNRGAKLIGRYSLVERKLPNGKTIKTLQQGSIASPMLSNLVGYEFIDKPVLAWLDVFKEDNPHIVVKYYRYCDNIGIFFNGEDKNKSLLNSISELKTYIIETLKEVGFHTHKWGVIPKSHPHKNQRFLGVVLNKVARIEKDRFEAWRALMFNACRVGMPLTATHFYDIDEGRVSPNDTSAKIYSKYRNSQIQTDIEKFKKVISGFTSYVNNINEKHGGMLRKLSTAASHLVTAWEQGKSLYAFSIEVHTGDTPPEFAWDEWVMYMPDEDQVVALKQAVNLHTTTQEYGILTGLLPDHYRDLPSTPGWWIVRPQLNPDVFSIISSYKNYQESEEEFITRLDKVIDAIPRRVV